VPKRGEFGEAAMMAMDEGASISGAEELRCVSEEELAACL